MTIGPGNRCKVISVKTLDRHSDTLEYKLNLHVVPGKVAMNSLFEITHEIQLLMLLFFHHEIVVLGVN